MATKTNPNVLMFGWEFPPFNSGGLGVACAGLSKALSTLGARVSFVLPYKVPVKASWCNFIFADESHEFKTNKEMMSMVAGYASHAVMLDQTSSKLTLSPFVGGLVERVMAYGLKAPGIASKTPHSVIHAHDWLTYPAGIAAKQESGKPLVAHIHATEFDRSGEGGVNQAIFDIEKLGFQEADMVVAVSGRTKKSVVDNYGIPEDKVKVVYNGVEFDPFISGLNSGASQNLERLKAEGNSIVLFAGRITLQKGPDYFVSMAEEVLRFEPKTFFAVSGSGDMEGQMIAEVARRGLAKNFIFCGFLRGNELARIFKLADIFVMPSVSEPFGIVPLEAMLSDTPVLISKESGVSEILSNALKSHFWDIADMTDKVVSLLREKKLHTHLQYNGKAEAKTIHWKKAADSLLSLYNSLVPSY